LKHQTKKFTQFLVEKNIPFNVVKKSFCDEPIFKQICNFFLRPFNNHEAAEDIDADGYSEYQVNTTKKHKK
jgi:hypothetical protein